MGEWENGRVGEWEWQVWAPLPRGCTYQTGAPTPFLPFSHSPTLPFSPDPGTWHLTPDPF